ncbi:MAG: hypothetical protein ACRCVD_12140, partial [Halioglobus sp.]
MSQDAGNAAVLGTDSLIYFAPTTFTGPGSKGYVPDPVAATGEFLRDDGTFAVVPSGPVGGISLAYLFDSSTASSNPGAGKLRINNANQTIATALYVSSLSSIGNNLDSIWGAYYPGDYIGIWERETQRESNYYVVNGALINNGGWWTIPVQYISGSGGVDNGAIIDAAPIAKPAARVLPGGAPGQVMAKTSAEDYAMAWVDQTAGGGVSDHGALTGLGDDDHTQYLNNARGDARYTPAAHVGQTGTAHGVATGAVAGFMSAADKNKLDGVAPGATANHGALAGLSADDHTQYLNNARGDARYPIRSGFLAL